MCKQGLKVAGSKAARSVQTQVAVSYLVLLVAGLPACGRMHAELRTSPAKSSRVAKRAHPQKATQNLDNIMLRAAAALEDNDLGTALRLSRKVLQADINHLEAWLVQAIAAPSAASKHLAWKRFDRLLSNRGKLRIFASPITLFAGAKHCLERQQPARAALFIDELWRRHPKSPQRKQIAMVATRAAYDSGRWAKVEKICTQLRRHGSDKSSHQQCADYLRNARRMQRIGPSADGTAGDWRWESPRIQGNTLYGAWLSPDGSIYAVGEGGAIVRGRNGSFRSMSANTRWTLRAIAGRSPRELYAVGDGGIVLRYDGSRWRTLRDPKPSQADLFGVATSRTGEMIAVGQRGAALHRDQSGNWRRQQAAAATLRAIVPGRGAMYAVGDGGTILRFSAGRWQPIESGVDADLFDVATFGQRLIAVGAQRTIVDCDEGVCRAGRSSSNLRALWGLMKKKKIGNPPRRQIVIWGVGADGAVARRAFGVWNPLRRTTSFDLHALVGRPGQRWAFGAGGTILHQEDGRWTLVAGGSRPNLIWIGKIENIETALSASGKLLRRNKDGQWRVWRPLPPGSYNGAWGDGARLAAVGGHGQLTLYGAGGPRSVATGTKAALRSVWGNSRALYVVGEEGTVLRVDDEGQVRSIGRPTTSDLNAVWGAGGQAIVVAGQRGVLLYHGRSGWKTIRAPTRQDLFALWGNADIAVAVGAHGTVIAKRRGDFRWRKLSTPTSQNLVAVWGRSRKEIFAASDRGTILRFDGRRWRVENSPATCVKALGSGANQETLAAGCRGSVLRLRPTSQRIVKK